MNEHTNTACLDWQPVLTDVLFGEASPEDAARFAEHTQTCAACRHELESLRSTLEAASNRPSYEPDEQTLARLEQTVLAQTVPPARIYRLPDFGRLTRRAVAVAAVLLVGVLIGRQFPGPAAVVVEQGELPPGFSPVELRAHSYLDRSKTLLLGVANFDTASEDPADLNLPQRSVIADELLQEANYLKSSLSASEQQRLRALVTELEIILLQLANLEAQADIPEIEIMQAGMDQNALLFKIDVEQMRRQEPGSGQSRKPGASV